MSGFIKKIQNLPERKRKIILWSIVIVTGLSLLIFWFKSVQKAFKNFPKEQLKETFQNPLQEKLKEVPRFEMPKLEIPEISEEELKK